MFLLIILHFSIYSTLSWFQDTCSDISLPDQYGLLVEKNWKGDKSYTWSFILKKNNIKTTFCSAEYVADSHTRQTKFPLKPAFFSPQLFYFIFLTISFLTKLSNAWATNLKNKICQTPLEGESHHRFVFTRLIKDPSVLISSRNGISFPLI